MINLNSLKRPTKQTELIACRVDAETKLWLEQTCKQAGISVSHLVNELIKDFKLNGMIK